MKSINLILSCLLLINTNCGKIKYDLKLRIYNISDKAIYASWTIDYPDTSFNHMANPTYNSQINKVEAHTLQKTYYGAPSEGLFDDKVDTLSVFIFDAKVLESNSWDTVKAKYLVLKRYDLSLDDLEKMNWTITYP